MNFLDMMAIVESTKTVTETTKVISVAELQEALQFDAIEYFAKADADGEQRQFNKAIARQLRGCAFVDSGMDFLAPAALMQIIGGAVSKIQAARQSEQDDSEAVQTLEYLLNFVSALAASVTRNGFYLHRRAEASDEPLDKRGLRSDYAGYSGLVRIEPESVIDACDALVNGYIKIHGNLSALCSAWFRSNRPFNCGGYRDGEQFVNFLSLNEAWVHFRSNVTEFVKVSGAEAAARLARFA